MLNCVDNLSELPVKAFYRFVLNHEPAASVDKLPKEMFYTFSIYLTIKKLKLSIQQIFLKL